MFSFLVLFLDGAMREGNISPRLLPRNLSVPNEIDFNLDNLVTLGGKYRCCFASRQIWLLTGNESELP